ncbi:lysis system i-spanin subunit Rz [Comamonas sp. CMM03]|uniref:lysis system i-spanin subunit Rz n=1 Tax=Comamonas sp. CMM03 TaxID=2854781 RepID=UPI001C45CC7E|nr:lysis system i-spanin subunit Rz [Comamonas sp. CMM03]MBV7418436.1 lysis system i-spanin subunit Rz [Comamonas sp. CMM03]
MTGRGKTILATLVLAGAFASGWVAQGWRSDAALAQLRQGHVGVLADIATKTRAAADAVRAYERQAGLALASADKKSTEDLKNAKAETQRMRDCVRAGTCGVRIVTRYVDQPSGAGGADAGAGGVGNDAITLDAGVSERVLDLRDAIAEDAAKLGYLQRYAEQCQRAGVVIWN